MVVHRSARHNPRHILPPVPASSMAASGRPISQEVSPAHPPTPDHRLSLVRRLSPQANQVPSVLGAPVHRRLRLHLPLDPRDHLEQSVSSDINIG